jgi:soluble lytic murein transglycosylase-like protein
MNMQQIYNTYGQLISASALKWHHRPEVVAAIIMKESSGNALAIGADGSDHGLMQLNDKVFPDFCAGESWKDPAANIDTGCQLLWNTRGQVIEECQKFQVTATESDIERMAIAGYNCGADRAVHYFRRGLDPDTETTNGNYSKTVLEFAAQYAEIMGG